MKELDMILAGPLSLALPSEEQTCFLRACLISGEEGRAAWTSWIERVRDPIAFLKREEEGVKAMLPLLFTALRKNGVSVDRTLQTILRTAYVNEEIRSESYGRICRSLFRAFRQRGAPVTVIKGADLAYTVYENPILRHLDSLELLIEEDDMETAIEVAGSIGCKIPGKPESSDSQTLECRHGSGLGIVFRRRLYTAPICSPSGRILERRQAASIARTSTQILSPADNLLFTCSLVYDSRINESMRWVCDCWFLVLRYPDLDWQVLFGEAQARQLSLPLLFSLDYLDRNFNLPIPSDFLSDLAADARETTVAGCEFALAGARRSKRGGLKALLRAAGSWRDRLFIVRWMVLPATTARSLHGGGPVGSS